MDNYSKIVKYIDDNPIGTIGTINLDGSPHGAVVYFCADDDRHFVYFLTKTGTRKYNNISAHDKVSLTIANPTENSTLQAAGRAMAIHDSQAIDMVFAKLARTQSSGTEWLPPISKLRAGAYVIVGIEILHARLAQFQGMGIGDEHIFTQV